MNFLEDVYILSHIKRYSTIFRLREESVAEHSFHVAAIVMQLHDKYEFNLGHALQMAIAHDMPEMELNDVPRVIKKKYPEINRAFEVCEQEVLEKLPKSVKDGCLWYNDNDSWESQIVHLADAMQCAQYATTEVNLGNSGYFSEVLSESLKRIRIMSDNLRYIDRDRNKRHA